MTRTPRDTSAEEPDGGNLHVRIRRGPGSGNWPGLLNSCRQLLHLSVVIAGSIIAGCLGSSTPTSSSTQPSNIIVDFAARQPDTQSMAGFINGMGRVPPSDDLIRQLQPRLVRGALARDLVLEGPRAGRLSLMNELGTRYVLTFSDMWGHPIAGWRCPWCPNLGPPYLYWNEWTNLVRTLTQRVLDLGVTNMVYEIWNEPTAREFWQGTEQQWLETYYRAERAIHTLDPNADVAGPSLGNFDVPFIQRFLDFCLNQQPPCEVNVLTWHELLIEPKIINPRDRPAGISEIAQHIQFAKQNFVNAPKYAPLRIREIHINEHTGQSDFYRPGEAVGYLAALERGGADAAARSCWLFPDEKLDECFNGSLGGLLDRGQPRAVWWVYRAYPDGVASRVSATVTDPALAVLASQQGMELNAAQILIGHNRLLDRPSPAPISLMIELRNVASAPSLAGAARVRVVVHRLPDSGRAPLVQPEFVKEVKVQVLNDVVRLDAGVIGVHEAFLIAVYPDVP